MVYNIDPRQQAVRDEVRAFAEKEIAPFSQQWDRSPDPVEFPRETYRKLGEAGFIGYDTPEEYGGRGKSGLEYATFMEEISYFDGAFGVISEIGKLVAWPVLNFGTEAQKKNFVPDCVSGKIIPAFALTEPGAGSDAANLKTVALDNGSEYILNGEKMFISSGDVADLALVFCKIEGQDKISAMLVDTHQNGWQPRPLERKMGIRISTTAAIKLDKVRVPKENLIGEPGKGFQYAMKTLDGARICVAAQSLGLSQRAIDEAVSYAKKRFAFGAPIAKLQAIQWMIADMSTRIEAARMLTYKAAMLQDGGRSFSLAAAQAKLFASETAGFCVDRAVQIHGGYGYIGEFSVVEKLYRDQRFLEIGEGSSEIQRLVIASNILGR